MEDLDQLQTEIIQDKNPALAYFFSTEFSYKPHLMQQIVLEAKNPKYCFLFAQNIKNCDIKALQKIVVESNNTKYICKFACFVLEAEIKPLEQIILTSKNVRYAHMLLKHVKGTNILDIKNIILTSEKPRYLFELAKHTKDPKDLAQIEDLIIKANSFTYMRLMAEKIKGANIDKLEQAILDTHNIPEIKKFARYVKRSKMKNFLIVL
jgi:hypothetical protein